MDLEDYFAYDSFREGQKELAAHVYESCKRSRNLVAEAASGFGKTAAVLSGALLAASELGSRILYVCRTKREVQRVLEEISKLQQDHSITAVGLFSKYDYCLLRQVGRPTPHDTFKWYCSFHTSNNLCSYFMNVFLPDSRVGNLAVDISSHYTPHQTLMDICSQRHLCPYEVGRLALPESLVIVTTYHYLFDEGSKSTLLSNISFPTNKTILIIDEAHNLRDFVRNLSTHTLSYHDLDRAIEEAKELGLDSVSSIQLLKNKTQEFNADSKGWFVGKQLFVQKLSENKDGSWLPNLSFELSSSAGPAWYAVSAGRALPLQIGKVGAFLTSLTSSLTKESVVLTRTEDSVSLVDVDPSKLFLDTISGFHNSILLSATINPSHLFLSSLQLPSTTDIHNVQPFDTLRIKTMLDVGVSTRFKSRNPAMFSKIASKTASIIMATEGNIGVFACSYSVLDSILEGVRKQLVDRTVLVEKKDLSSQEANQMMNLFKTRDRCVLLGVQGGRFSEGEDFEGGKMEITVVVGLSFPPPSPILYAEYSFLKKKGISSYLVASLLPALRKAFQSAGRHIRSPDKRGLVFLLDWRFGTATVFELMPQWLRKDVSKGDFTSDEIVQNVRAMKKPQ